MFTEHVFFWLLLWFYILLGTDESYQGSIKPTELLSALQVDTFLLDLFPYMYS